MLLKHPFIFWGVLIALTLWLVGLLSNILLPFVAGMAVAYFLDPVADRLEDIGLSRVMATTILTVIFFIVLILSLFLLIPLIAAQVQDLANSAPGYIATAKTFVNNLMEGPLARFFNGETGPEATEALERLRKAAISWSSGVLQNVINGSSAFLSFMSLIFITPVVSFYMLNDWDRIVAYVDKLLPRDHADVIRKIMREIDKVLSGFVRGMGSICSILMIYYAVALEAAGLNFGLVVGLIAGAVSFIPFVGMATGLILSMTLALFQFLPDQPVMVAIVFGIFLFGQVLEGNILTPLLVGNRIGLHPVWVIFGLLAFGSLFGFVGMLLAVPVAAAIGVVVRHFTGEYLKSPLYWGRDMNPLAMAGQGTEMLEAMTGDKVSKDQDETGEDAGKTPDDKTGA